MSCEEDEVLFERLVDPRELVKSTKRRFAALAVAASAPPGTNGTAITLDQSVTDELTRIVRAELAPLNAQSLTKNLLLALQFARSLTRPLSAVEANHAAVIQMLQTMQVQHGGDAAVVPRVKRRAPPKKKEAPVPAPAPAIAVEVDEPGCKEKVDAVKVEPVDDFVFNERAARKFRAQMSRTTNGTVYSL
jgi:hypothetical protein